MAKIISFLATKRLPQIGQLDKKEKYSLILILFHLCEHEIQIIAKSNHHSANKKAAECGAYDNYSNVILRILGRFL
tara:strand:- start:466 stop:693 length:228 start_codon:yes stop_codon:yes gene_type:complete